MAVNWKTVKIYDLDDGSGEYHTIDVGGVRALLSAPDADRVCALPVGARATVSVDGVTIRLRRLARMPDPELEPTEGYRDHDCPVHLT